MATQLTSVLFTSLNQYVLVSNLEMLAHVSVASSPGWTSTETGTERLKAFIKVKVFMVRVTEALSKSATELCSSEGASQRKERRGH
ncbi:hypothetical protein NQZ68_017913 [Dissostichus eleginoides]|nr:hypothetical protein NQZ68_017913 [Dissostichus eleginoides]